MGFSASWLALREPADHRARDTGLLAAATKAAGTAPVIVDLGSGTGSTIRALAPYQSQPAVFRLVDNDPVLLANAAQATQDQVTTHLIDLTDLGSLPLDGATLVTASALLDLCSRDWVERLADLLATHEMPFYTALNYDGVMTWSPVDAADDAVTHAFNRHQRGDKGFGAALGPECSVVVAEIFRAAGFTVHEASSPWRLGPNDAALQRELLQGIAAASLETGETSADAWLARRVDQLDLAQCLIGHQDMLALPPRLTMAVP